MKIDLCPKCKTKAGKVSYDTVDSLVKKKIEKKDYLVCKNENCEVVYFNKTKVYRLSDLKVQVWFKNDSNEECPICYCSKLTRREIKTTVNKGYETIEGIREYTGKKTTGNCMTKNPLGRCCHKAFQKEIIKYKSLS